MLFMSIDELKEIVKNAERLHKYQGYSDTILIEGGERPTIVLRSYYSEINDYNLVDNSVN